MPSPLPSGARGNLDRCGACAAPARSLSNRCQPARLWPGRRRLIVEHDVEQDPQRGNDSDRDRKDLLRPHASCPETLVDLRAAPDDELPRATLVPYYRPSTTSMLASNTSIFARESLPTRSVSSTLSRATICDAFATESFGRFVLRADRRT